ncbi:hypothetical protein C475_17083 [Halosimplex carlsbadense 2-9-1]|uniref:DUF8009 domain-containing protein n=1 Tax=Halosimplex carlsbadense 2-9-1 TaxID=797114 RepID=M0CIP9_9EURY|nr:hypothetical protein [Halosimplex carlsbadense]ELZ22247.1 hypothetical protein C475_17083 [Halosimplex carlsbadense 2-9-1]
MDGASDDPRQIRTLAVTAEDVVAALEARAQRDQSVVLRATPPFSGRMRARLHVGAGEYDESPAPLHVDPEALLDDAAPTYPRPGDTEDELRDDPDVEYTVERHHDRHEEAVAAWRETVLDHVRDTASVETPQGPHEVGVSLLG